MNHAMPIHRVIRWVSPRYSLPKDRRHLYLIHSCRQQSWATVVALLQGAAYWRTVQRSDVDEMEADLWCHNSIQAEWRCQIVEGWTQYQHVSRRHGECQGPDEVAVPVLVVGAEINKTSKINNICTRLDFVSLDRWWYCMPLYFYWLLHVLWTNICLVLWFIIPFEQVEHKIVACSFNNFSTVVCHKTVKKNKINLE